MDVKVIVHVGFLKNVGKIKKSEGWRLSEANSSYFECVRGFSSSTSLPGGNQVDD